MKSAARSSGAYLLVVAGLGLIAACTEPVSWQTLLASKIVQQYPAYRAEPHLNGNLRIERPGLAPVEIDVNDIARFCQRGVKDCDYATDKMLTDLAPPAPR